MSEIVGYTDCIQRVHSDNSAKVYEFKCTSKLKAEHYLQLIIYMCMYESWKRDNNIKEKTKYYLYNILSDELNEIECDYEILQLIVIDLVKCKYGKKHKINDTQFIKECLNVSI